MQDMSRIAYRQFEIKGYEKMLERMLEQPMAGANANNNAELQQKLLHIKDTLSKQQEKNREIERETEKKVIEEHRADRGFQVPRSKNNMFMNELDEALQRQK